MNPLWALSGKNQNHSQILEFVRLHRHATACKLGFSLRVYVTTIYYERNSVITLQTTSKMSGSSTYIALAYKQQYNHFASCSISLMQGDCTAGSHYLFA